MSVVARARDPKVGAGTMIAHDLLHRSGRAELPHPAPTLGEDAQADKRIRMTNEPAETIAQGSASCGATADDCPGCDDAVPSATGNPPPGEKNSAPGRSWAPRNSESDPTGPSASTLLVPERACQVFGISGDCGIAVGGVSARHAVVWQNGVPIDLGNIGGNAWNTPTAINNQ